jgi:hypothetical protein
MVDNKLAKTYGNDFAIWIACLIYVQQYFQRKDKENIHKGRFFWPERQQIDQCNMSHYTLVRMKRLAISLGIIKVKMQSFRKSTKEWYTIYWKKMYEIYQGSGYVISTTQSGYTESHSHLKTTKKMKNDVTDSLSERKSLSPKKEWVCDSTGVYNNIINKTKKEIEKSLKKISLTRKQLMKINCPHEHVIGVDYEKYNECETCKVWEECCIHDLILHENK